MSIAYQEKKKGGKATSLKSLHSCSISFLLFSISFLLFTHDRYQILACTCNYGLQKLVMQALS